jgi:DNA (cytosine-5)-methyltransferase 1
VRAATLFSGIGAPEAARPDWRWLWSAEIEPFPSAVLAARHPSTVNLGDVTAHDFAERALAIGRPDVLVFGSPCQSFSVAGKRLGLDDPRGNLALVALAVVRAVRPSWFLFENVPGLLSSEGGRDFGTFLRAVAECGYFGCWRVLDAQHFGLAQRRQRVFFVGHLGDWRPAAEVLFEPESLRGHPAPGREAGQGVARPLSSGSPGGSGYRNDADTADDLIAFNHLMGAKAGGIGAAVEQAPTLGTRLGGGAVAYGGNDTRGPIEVATALNAHGGPHGRLDFESETFVAQAFNWKSGGDCRGLDPQDVTAALQCEQTPAAHIGPSVRRLTPVECERLQGFPDGHTAIAYRGKPAADGPRYRALGNSMAVPVVRWLLARIEAVDQATTALGDAA